MANEEILPIPSLDDDAEYRKTFAKMAMLSRYELITLHGKDMAEVLKLSDHDAFDLLNEITKQAPMWVKLPLGSPRNLKRPKRSSERRFLAPVKHNRADFFLADVIDAAVKDDMNSMEHPIFSLKKSGDTEIRRYEHNGVHIEVTPSVKGIATIWDKDVLIYAISQLIAKSNEDIPMCPTVRFKAYDLLVSTNRGIGGREYDNLEAALERLAGTRVKTDLRTSDQRTREGFGLIESWKIVERRSDERMDFVEITLSDWLYRAVLGKEVLTLDRDYFRLSSSIDRRLYEIGRKHCGNQNEWPIGLALLQKKTGSRSDLREFREQIRKRVERDHLPEYHLDFDAGRDVVIFRKRTASAGSPTIGLPRQ